MKAPHSTHFTHSSVCTLNSAGIARLMLVVLTSLAQLGCVSDLEHELNRHDGRHVSVQSDAEAPSTESESDSRQVTDPAIDDDAVTEHEDPSMIDAATTGPTSKTPRGSSGDARAPSQPLGDSMTAVPEVPNPITEEDASSPAPDGNPEHGECDADTCGTDGELDGTAGPDGGCSPPCANDPGIIGAACTDAQECASGNCVDGSCVELDLLITHEGLDDEMPEFLVVNFVIERDTALVNWEDLAFLYFFTPEVHYDFHTSYESDPESTRLCVELDTELWAYVWRSSKVGPVQRLENSFTALVNDETWVAMDNTNDHSYMEAAGPNPNVVVCRRMGSQWYYAQGNGPPGVDDPCGAVEPDCSQVSCDDPTD